ncbi:aldehyde dehydrogenase [Tatumella morbirosei]|uniref:Aldehyde dehydrogenase n=1 Tax=Tatumella morbirosei TaxID=642227 RepID=A0A095TDU9_9GAMM|nr:molybdopterin cofactor-binding domain-containing protein [Tatumella morbirosei]KGD74699.1 aldehyde dehydrogenase [Tatumella morbirosei]
MARLPEKGQSHTLTRRGFLVAMTAVGVSFGFPRKSWSAMDPASANGVPLPDVGSLYEPNLWYSIDASGKVKVNIIRAEIGQHVGTAIARILADELDVSWDNVEIIHVDSDKRWGLMVTGGSWSVSQSWPVYRQAGAAGRVALTEAAASLLGEPATNCVTRDGYVICGSKRISYGELVSKGISRHFTEQQMKALPLKPDDQLSLVGREVMALDIHNKTTGQAIFGIDARVDGMVYATVVLPPTRQGSSVSAVDDSEAKKVRGYQQYLVLEDPSDTVPGWVVVTADSMMAATRAAKKLNVTWKAGAASTVSEADIIAHGRTLINDPSQGAILDTGDTHTEPVFSRAASVVEYEYLTHTVLHGQMEPLNALVFRNPKGIWEIHCGSQWQSLITPTLAKALQIPEEQVVIRAYLSGGGFGRRLNGDYMVPAALASKALGGKPVKLVLMRAEDMQFDSPRSSSVQKLRMAFDADKKVIAMEHDATAGWPTQVMVPSFMPNGINGKPFDPFAIAGADHWYSVGAQKVRAISNDLANNSFRPGWLRSVSPGWVGWAVESFMDEAAHHAGQDPLAFRLSLLDGKGRNAGSGPIAAGGAKRQAAVLKKAAELIGWGTTQPENTGLGIASTFGQERDMPTWVACAVRVHVDSATGLVDVQKMTIVVDAGIIVDPNGAEAQCQGAALWGLSMALYEGSELVNGRFKDSNFDTYTPLRLRQTPEVEVVFIKSTAAPSGLGEPAVTPVAPAIANAIFAVTGVRMRSLPMRTGDIKAALDKHAS